MRSTSLLPGLLAVLPAVRGVAFASPSPTSTSLENVAAGISLKPTTPPSVEELRRRQTDSFPETCGWVDGIYSLAVKCPGAHTCMLYTEGAGMAGCCDSTNTVDCGWASSCMDAAEYMTSGCGSNCLLNTLVRKCTDSSLPYCATWTFPSGGVLGYGCVDYSDTSIATVLQHATDDFGATTTMTLATATANPAITDSANSKVRNTAKKLAIGVIVGIVVVALFIVCCIAFGILFCVKRRRKQREIAASTQAMAAVHATRPPSQFPPPPVQQVYQYPTLQPQQAPQMHMQQPSLFSPSVGPQSPVMNAPSYIPQGPQEEKPGAYTSVQEYPVSPPVSSPSTPAPVYAQPQAVPPSPMPVVSQYQVESQAHEVDAVSMPHVPGQEGPVHEIGNGK
ncbi:hypothetical protein SVAN01_01925 [Stagonosporopsis vannaccii]|nr:hypothetical protein SVAN01_01925 [Stagonosporopsis vannaccii]